MITVAIKELKNRLSAYLREVSKGELVLVTDRGRVVAELRQPRLDRSIAPDEQALEHLEAEGSLQLGLPQHSDAYLRSPLRAPVASQSLLDAERGET